MKAIVLDSQGPSLQTNYSPGDTKGIRVRVLQAGICETDLQLIQGYMGFQGVLGHEFVGLAEDGRFAGQRVVGEINCPCGECPTCQAGMGNHCPRRSVLGILNHDGCFAESVWLPEANLHPVPDHVTDDMAVFTEPLAAAFQIPAQVPFDPDCDAIILGDGRLANLCAQVLKRSGLDLLVIGKHDHKLKRLADLGIRTRLLADVSEGRVADLVVDCTGSPTGFPTACQLVRPRGTIVLKTTIAGESGPNLAPLVIDEIQVIGSRCGPFVPALQALADGSIDVASLITARYGIDDGLAALQAAQQKDQLKVLLKVS